MTPIGQQTRGSIRLQKPGVLQRGDLRLEALQLGILASCVGAQIVGAEVVGQAAALGQLLDGAARAERQAVVVVQGGVAVRRRARLDFSDDAFRSEEHTSELQSLMRISYAVFCLRKKNKHTHEPESP